METLSEVLKGFIETIAVDVSENAEISGRTCAGIQDVCVTLHDLGYPWRSLNSFAFEDKSENNSNLSHVKKESNRLLTYSLILTYLLAHSLTCSIKWNQPFPLDLENFPVKVRSKPLQLYANQSLSQVANPAHIPKHLPTYPPPHTYGGRKREREKEKDSKDAAVAAAAAASVSSGQGSSKHLKISSLPIIENVNC